MRNFFKNIFKAAKAKFSDVKAKVSRKIQKTLSLIHI